MVSKKPRTQRRNLYNMKLHELRSLVSVHLSKELKKKLSITSRSLQVRKGDRVKVTLGNHKGKSGKVTKVDLKESKVYIEGIMSRKAKGGEIPVPFDPSNLLLLDGNFEDKGRKKVLTRKKSRG